MSDCADVLSVYSVPAVHVRPRPPDIMVPLVWNRVDHDSARFVAVTFASSWRIVPVAAHADPDIVNGCCCYQWIPAQLQVCDLSMQYGMDGTPSVDHPVRTPLIYVIGHCVSLTMLTLNTMCCAHRDDNAHVRACLVERAPLSLLN